jgi:hypothetical protein
MDPCESFAQRYRLGMPTSSSVPPWVTAVVVIVLVIVEAYLLTAGQGHT